MGCCENLLGCQTVIHFVSWKTYLLSRLLSPLIQTDKLLVLLPFHHIVTVFTAQRKQRDFQSREAYSILAVGRPGDRRGLWPPLNQDLPQSVYIHTFELTNVCFFVSMIHKSFIKVNLTLQY